MPQITSVESCLQEGRGESTMFILGEDLHVKPTSSPN